MVTKLKSLEMAFDQKNVMDEWHKIIDDTNRVKQDDLVSTIIDVADEANEKD